MPNVGKKKPAPKSGRDERASRPQSNTPAIRREVKLLIWIGIGILLLLSTLAGGSMGVVGQFFRDLSRGLFGLGGVFLPLGIMAYSVLCLMSREFRVPLWRGIILSWVMLALLYIIMPVPENNYTAMEYLRAVYSRGHLGSGGIIGAILGSIVQALFNRAVAIIIFLLVVIILLVNILNRSFVKLLEGGFWRARNYYDDRKARQHEDDEAYYAQEEEYAKSAPKSQKLDLKPIPKRKTENVSRRAELIDIGDDETDYNDEDDYRVLLIQEELDGNNDVVEDASPRGVPPFLSAEEHRRRVSNPRVVSLHGVEEAGADSSEKTPLPTSAEEQPFVDYVYEPARPASAICEPSKTGRITPAEDHDDIDDASLPDKPDFVVRGLVENAAPSMPPLFEYDDLDPLEYDEYASVTSVETPKPTEPPYKDFVLPSLDLLTKNEKLGYNAESMAQVRQNAIILEETLGSFRIDAKVVDVSVGPTVTRYDLTPGPGVKVSSIANLSNDLALSLAAQGIRIEAPIPGKSAVGIEIPNKEPRGVFLRDILEQERFNSFPSKLAFAVGEDIAGNPVVADVADMPHLLIAGATGAGKSVCINTLIASLLYKASPDEVKLLMIDPKVVELSVYNGIPHLLIPVVTDPKKASGALNWAVQEMETRYNAFAETGCRDLKGYNRHLSEKDEQTLPQVVIIIDELADLMMTCKGEVEDSICRLAQKARAAGIHLIVATQRPSVDVITGLIKANIPSRLAFAVSSGTDSRTVLDMQGAEKLLGRGDMLFLPRGQNKPIRVQGGFISDKEVENLVAFLKAQAPVTHTTEMIQQITMPGKANVEGEVDEFFHDAVEFLLVKGKASTSMLQRQFRIGYNRASRLMDDLELRGIVGPEDGVKPRKVTITREEYGEIYGDR